MNVVAGEFIDYVIADVLRLVPDLVSRAMFGGYGIYSQGTIFAIVVDDQLYFKVSDANRAEYEAAGSEPFTYERRDGVRATMSYWSVPGEVMDDPEAAAEWARRAWEVSAAD
jgi:DNA transformation protein